MRRYFLLLLALLPALSLAQVPNEEDILRQTMDSSSPYYFTKLMMRYNNLERLSPEEYHYLYYGFAYQDDYKPTATNTAAEELYATLPSINTTSPDRAELEHIVSVCNDALKVDPFSPMVLNMLVFAYGAMGESEKELAYYYHLNGIMETIKASGDGRTEKEPMHIIMFSHAYNVLSSMGMAYKRGEIVSRNVEFVPLHEPRRMPDGKKVRGYYFDFSRIYRNKPDEVTFQKKRTWQFNNLGPREYK